jgi:hypothetical protein
VHTPEEVFVTDGYPKFTYVPLNEGEKETELRDGLEQQNKIISIAGPSKSGKTTLCEQVFGTEQGVDRLYVTGDTLEKGPDLWHEAYRQITDDTDKTFHELSSAQVRQKLIDAGLPLIIDDFHYIPRDIQPAICRQLKNAASAGLRIVCLSVPHRGDDPIRNNPDLAGRYFSITFDYWAHTDLQQIAHVGFPLVGFPNVESFNSLLATEALRSPQIMQTLCLEACRMHGKDKALENVKPTARMLTKIKALTLRSYNYKTSYELLEKGPATRGSDRILYKTEDKFQLDVYQCLIKALSIDPEFLTLSLDDIRDRFRSFLKDSREPNVRSALQQLDGLYKDKEMNCPVDWDDEKKSLSIIDPHFYFYLRNKD